MESRIFLSKEQYDALNNRVLMLENENNLLRESNYIHARIEIKNNHQFGDFYLIDMVGTNEDIIKACNVKIDAANSQYINLEAEYEYQKKNTSNTIRELEERVKEKDTKINDLVKYVNIIDKLKEDLDVK